MMPGWGPLTLRATNSHLHPNVFNCPGPESRRRRQAATRTGLLLFAPHLLAQTLPRKRFLCTAFLAGLHVEAMLLDFLDDVFLLHLALETPQCVFQRLTLLDNDFSHCVPSPPIRLGLATL